MKRIRYILTAATCTNQDFTIQQLFQAQEYNQEQ